MATQPFEIERHGGYVDLLLNPSLAVSGQILAAACHTLRTTFPNNSVSIGTNPKSDSKILGIRLHGASAQTAEALANMELFPTALTTCDESPMVRYVHKGRAYFDAAQVMTVDQLMAARQRVEEACTQEAGFKGCYGNFDFWRSQLRLSVAYRENFISDGEKLLRRLFPPMYATTSNVTGGIHEGKVYIKLDTPSALNLSDSGVLGLDFVLADPEAIYMQSEDRWPGHLWVYVQADPDNIEELWLQASAIALKAGVHPVGNFYFHRNSQLGFDYKPSALTGR
jgi:hypothetical protein